MPTSEDKKTAKLRNVLLDQLKYLIDEVEALKGIVERVPVKLQEGRPLQEDLSIKETYGLLAALDEQVHTPFVEHVESGGGKNESDFSPDMQQLARSGGWNEMGIQDILDRVQEARSNLIVEIKSLDEADWGESGMVHGEERDVYELAHFITQHDVERLREMGYRLHESDMDAQPQQQASGPAASTPS